MKQVNETQNSTPDCLFIGYQETSDGKTKYPLFNITRKGHPKENSTVTLETLMHEGLKFPPYFLEYHECKAEYEAGCGDPDCSAVFNMCVCGESVSASSYGCRSCNSEIDDLYGGD